jgi:hypothetical protein
METLEHLEPLLPVDFFSIRADLKYGEKFPTTWSRRPFILPDTSELLGEEKFAEIALAWNEHALLAEITVEKPFEQCFYPRFSEGDSIELFIDTRDMKSAGFLTRFCHHFVFLPQEVGGIKAQEITHFRTEDTHPLCDAEELLVETKIHSSQYTTRLTIPASCLHGYDPLSFDRLGFTYRINRKTADPQHFSVSSRYYSIEQHPSLWASLKLIK